MPMATNQKRICSVADCGRPTAARGLCSRHINRLYHGKDPTTVAPTLIERFLGFVTIQTEGCWNWTGATAGGYGQFSCFGGRIQAHRFSYEVFVAGVNHMSLVCHRCDNKRCVRPDHLFEGTASDNMRDMIAKGKHPKSLSKYRAKLTADDVRAIRSADKTVTQMAKDYGVSNATIQKARDGINWKNVT